MYRDAAIHTPRIDASEGAVVIGDVRLPTPSSKSTDPGCVEGLRLFRRVYGEAFDSFLKMTNSPWPEAVDDPAVALTAPFPSLL